MKKISILVLLLSIIAFAGCTNKNSVTFDAVIQSTSQSSMLVTTINYADFDKASVAITKNTKILLQNQTNGDITSLENGDSVTITFNGFIRESYPIQITADKIIITAKASIPIKTEYRKITAAEANAQLDTDKSIILIDVRTEAEFLEKRIAGSILIPDFDIAALAPEKLPNKTAKLYIYCRSGRRSDASARALVAMGYTNVYDFGGIIDWPYETISGQ